MADVLSERVGRCQDDCEEIRKDLWDEVETIPFVLGAGAIGYVAVGNSASDINVGKPFLYWI